MGQFVTAPNIIEVSDFADGGFAPDVEPPAMEPNQLLDALNLLPDNASTALRVREGFSRVRAAITGDVGRYILHVTLWQTAVNGTNTDYVIIVTSNGLDAANNVKLYALNLADLSVTRMDTAGVNWDDPTSWHWGFGAGGKWYGGSTNNDMYSWNPDTATWDNAAGVGNYRTLVDDTNAGVDTTLEYGRDFAFTGKEQVLYGSHYYKADTDIRFRAWESGQHYSRGDKVSLHGTWSPGVTYWKSWRCIKAHDADGTNEPELGSGSPGTYWEKLRLDLPTDADGDTNTDDWTFVPQAPQTHLAMWYANRAWFRGDGYGPKDRVLYTAPVQPNKGQDMPSVVWDPTDFAVGDDARGPGGGWLEFTTGRASGAIRAMRPFGQYALFWKRTHTWVLSGQSDESWTVRVLASGVGILGPRAHIELDGLVYFAADDGLYVTDGTAAEMVPGMGNIRDWWRARVDLLQEEFEDAEINLAQPVVGEWQGQVFVTFSGVGGVDGEYLTLFYDPQHQTFWKTDLPIIDYCKTHRATVSKLFFAAPPSYGNGKDLLYVYGGDTDDAGETDSTNTPDVRWYLQTAWWPFGLVREQRRIRRVWAVVKGVMSYTIQASRDWDLSKSNAGVTHILNSEAPGHIEGSVIQDSHALSLYLEGTRSPASVYGLAVQTEPRRTRYHT